MDQPTWKPQHAGATERCASVHCPHVATWRIDHGGTGSVYCDRCHDKIEQASDHYDDSDDGECFMCGGSGELDECECSAFEDTCCCLTPIPRACPECIERERDRAAKANGWELYI